MEVQGAFSKHKVAKKTNLATYLLRLEFKKQRKPRSLQLGGFENWAIFSASEPNYSDVFARGC